MRIGQTRLVVAIAVGLCAWSLSADAQQPTKVPRVGILSDEIPSLGATTFEPFAQGLRDLGWVEGQNVAFERRYAEGKLAVLESLAADLTSSQPNVILAIGTPAARAAKNATQTIPIVFARIGDPIGSGFVASLARPGRNLTGVSVLTRELAAKRLELLITAVPDAKHVGALWDPSVSAAGAELKEVGAAAKSLNLELITAGVRGPADFQPALQTMVNEGAGALIMVPPLQGVADLMAKVRLPTMFPRKEFVEAGGLMSYGPNFPEMYRRAAAYVDKILRGAKPSDIPVEQPTKFELVINLKTAKALGLTLPLTLLGRADEVIE